MDLRFLDVDPTAAERAAVDGLLGQPDSNWVGAVDRSAHELRVVRGGADARSKRHLLLPALNAVQADIGWISRGALDYICKRLSVPPAEAYGVASFYALLAIEERPPRVAHVCDDIVCRNNGAMELMAGLEGKLGPTGSDVDGTTWMPSPCLGQCDQAPAVYFQLAGERDDVLTGADASGVLGRLRGEPVPGAKPGSAPVGRPEPPAAATHLRPTIARFLPGARRIWGVAVGHRDGAGVGDRRGQSVRAQREGGRRLSHRDQVGGRRRRSRVGAIPHLQRRRVRARYLQGPRADGGATRSPWSKR